MKAVINGMIAAEAYRGCSVGIHLNIIVVGEIFIVEKEDAVPG